MTTQSTDSTHLNARAPRRFGWRVLFVVGALSAAVAGATALLIAYSFKQQDQRPTPVDADGVRHQCPMHPSIVQDHPGECPICGMKLVKVETGKGSAAAASKLGERKILYYRAPMDPKVTSPAPKKDEPRDSADTHAARPSTARARCR